MRLKRQQRGLTLVMTLLMLVIISMFAVSNFNSSTTNMRAAGNMLARQEAMAAAQAPIEAVISSSTFASDPDAVAASPENVDIDGDGTTDYVAQLTPAPACNRARTLKILELDPDSTEDVVCLTSGVAVNSGIDGGGAAGTAGNSLCANTEWNVRAVVTDANTGTQVAVNQGVGIRVLATEADDFCS